MGIPHARRQAEHHPPPARITTPHPTPVAGTRYLDNAKFTDALNKWRAAPVLNQPAISARITEDYFYPLAREGVRAFNIENPNRSLQIEDQDLIQAAVISCWKRMKHFKVERLNPQCATAFSFFTQIIKNAISTEYRREMLDCRKVNYLAAPINDETDAEARPVNYSIDSPVTDPLTIISQTTKDIA